MLPVHLAGRVHRPTRADRLVDQAIERAQIARSLIGLGATFWLLYSYPVQESAKGLMEDRLVELIISAGLLLVLAPLMIGAFVFSARPPGPAFYRRRLRGPLLSLGVLLATAVAFWAGVLQQGYTNTLFGAGALGMLLTPVLGFLALFSLPFTLASAALCVHHAFRTADVHEVLPPLISPVLVWALAIVQVFDKGPVDAPLPVRILFLLGPPLSVTALSGWELRRLRVRYGITLRAALGRPVSGVSSRSGAAGRG
ncbi:hypothetical protein OHS33_27625 [Streptomyces sp. NBC_00536]|uniref:hypothetical protein n=1 Tax=Streptomyces sp. NBC_00536 TaxID=2975769 RepID=UPI002E813CBF|nr:hypothetical protein [Streptomyces sp. NBC_00536]WUC81776.1 hypothetical protein OHS33_27625 [Streptomyces sp. NBC_00536]